MWGDSSQKELSNLQPIFATKRTCHLQLQNVVCNSNTCQLQMIFSIAKLVANDNFSFNDYDHL
jgi:hypothetical protein